MESVEEYNLQVALAWLKRYPDQKLFVCRAFKGRHRPIRKWSEPGGTSNDPDQIYEWMEEAGKDAYACMDLRDGSLFCVDLDNKHGKNGEATLQALEAKHGRLPDTFMVGTPSNGSHNLLKHLNGHKLKTGSNVLGTGIDVPVMIPVPGSKVPGKGGEYRIEIDLPIAQAPEWLYKIAPGKKSKQKSQQGPPLTEPDDPEIEKRAVKYLTQKAPIAVEGNNGEKTTLEVARHLHDLGIHQDKAGILMLEHYNPRCLPPWDPDELIYKVGRAYGMCESNVGSKSPMVFNRIATDLDEDGNVTERRAFSLAAELWSAGVGIEWVCRGLLEKNIISMWFGAPASKKSFLALGMGLAVSLGREWAGFRTTQMPVIILAAEGRGGMGRRIRAAMDAAGVTPEDNPPLYISNLSFRIDIWEDGAEEIVNQIRSIPNLPKGDFLLLLDTLASSFGAGDENSTRDMNSALNNLKRIREEFQGRCTIHIIHHSGHKETERARGASALEAGLDYVAQVEKLSDQWTVLRSPRKMKDGVPPPDLYFRSLPIEVGKDDEGEPVTSLAMIHAPGGEDDVKDAIIIRKGNRTANKKNIASILQDHGAPLSDVEILEELNLKTRKRNRIDNVRRTLRGLVADGILEESNGIFSIKPQDMVSEDDE